MRRFASGSLLASLLIASAPASASPKSALRGELGIGPVRGGAIVSQALESRLGSGVCAVPSAVDITIDPSGYVDSVNLYAPMKWDVVNLRDPTGRQSVETDEDRCRQEAFAKGMSFPDAQARCVGGGQVEAAPPSSWSWEGLSTRWDNWWERSVTAPAQAKAREELERRLAEIAEHNAPPPEHQDVVPEKVYPKQTFVEGSNKTVRGVSRAVKGGVEAAPMVVLPAGALARHAPSALQGARLRKHLQQLEKYGAQGFKELESGRIRYYGEVQTAASQGAMAGRRLVREWDPSTGATRTWHETIDRAGRVRIVRPQRPGPKTHYVFDEAGKYVGSR